jgi:hypothetical protein
MKANEQDHLMKSMAPRILLTPQVLQRFPLLILKGCCKYLQQASLKKLEQK